MTTLTKEEMEQLEKECPMVDIGFDPEEIDGRGIIEEDNAEAVETEEIVEEEAE
ncbi:MAG: hypothetical protein J6W64_11025 [Bacilli bacterium]|nr:hypothetical protein [Bacilli bacterium]